MNPTLVTEKNSDIRRIARTSLKTIWPLAVTGVLLYNIIADVPNMVFESDGYTAEQLQQILIDLFERGTVPTIPRITYIDTFYGFLVTGPLTFGLVTFLMNLFRRNLVRPREVFLGFSNFRNTFVLHVLKTLLCVVLGFFFVIPGVICAYTFAMSYYILSDNPDMRPVEAMQLSRKMMKGNKWKLFTLHLSFVGFWMLTAFTYYLLASVSYVFGAFVNAILSAALSAYVITSETAFYELASGNLRRKDPFDPPEPPLYNSDNNEQEDNRNE